MIVNPWFFLVWLRMAVNLKVLPQMWQLVCAASFMLLLYLLTTGSDRLYSCTSARVLKPLPFGAVKSEHGTIGFVFIVATWQVNFHPAGTPDLSLSLHILGFCNFQLNSWGPCFWSNSKLLLCDLLSSFNSYDQKQFCQAPAHFPPWPSETNDFLFEYLERSCNAPHVKS